LFAVSLPGELGGLYRSDDIAVTKVTDQRDGLAIQAASESKPLLDSLSQPGTAGMTSTFRADSRDNGRY
jgi:hypothetical protein